ncbi:MAG: aminotransferase class I/II-fold pyridoxal phosphate-dependent enzyme [Clostridia bacterium]
MIFFKNDYSEGMHLKVLDAIIQTNNEQLIGYGEDIHSLNAQEMIKTAIKQPNADVHLLVGGTQTNLIAISAFLRPHEAVISTSLGHIANHETGAIEATGHKVIAMPCQNGILTAKMIEQAMLLNTTEHMVKPKMVYISNSTELGTIYTKKMLKEVYDACQKYGLYLYLDGARIAVALTCQKNDLTLEEISQMCDAFYIGGTKCGAIIGEALVILNENLKADLRYYIKQKGAMLAKGRLAGVTFEALMRDNLLFEIAKNANETALMLTKVLKKHNIEFEIETETNQIFVNISNELEQKLQEFCHYEVCVVYENSVQVRFVTSFATPKSDIVKFDEILTEILA